MKCVECGNQTFIHLLFVVQCEKCEKIQLPPIEDTEWLDAVKARNYPEERDIAFVPKKVDYEEK